MIQVSKNFYERVKAGYLPEILVLLGSSTGERWVFGKTYPSIEVASSNLWDGNRLYGEGTYGNDFGLVVAGARVLQFGSITHQISYSNKDFLLSLSQTETGSMQVVLDNADVFFSDMLGGDKAVSFLNFTFEITCGFPDLDFSDAIKFFSGTVIEESLTNKSFKVVADGKTSSLLETYTMPRSGRYANPQNDNDILNYVYGNTAENSSQGVSMCPYIDTVNFRYCLCAHALPNTATVKIFVDNELVTTGYDIVYSSDLESQGVIAYVEFDTEQTGVVSMNTTKGKDSLTNPIDIMQDILSVMEDTTTQHANSWNKAARDAATLGYVAAGVLNSDQPPSFWLTNLLSNFLGSWYLNTNNELVVTLDSSLRDINPAGYLREYEAVRISGMRTRGNLCNQLVVNYGYILTDSDKRFKNNANPQYLAFEDGESTKDTSSQGKYGVVKKTLDLQWVRNTATVTALQTWVISQYALPVWTITYPETDIKNILVEPGDYVAYSWEAQHDDAGEPVKNQLARVLRVTRDLDALTVSFDLMDTGEYLSTVPYLWDGTHTYGEPFTTYGSNRDRRNY